MKKKYIGIGLLIALFLLITILVITNNTSSFDENIYKCLFNLRNNFFDVFFKTMTILGEGITVVIIAIIIFIFLKKEERYILVSSLIASTLFNQIMKFSIRRARPDHLRIIDEWGYSYTSGHSTISVALYGFLIYLVYKKINNKILKTILILSLNIIIIGIGTSRIYLGVHHTSDVLGGYISSLLILILLIYYFNNRFRGKINDKNGSK